MEADHSAQQYLLGDIEGMASTQANHADSEGLQAAPSSLERGSYHPDSEGLQFVENSDNGFRGYRDTEGLQPVIEPSDPAPSYSKIVPDAAHNKKDGGYFAGSQPLESGHAQQGMLNVPSEKKKRKKWLIIGGVIAAIIIILAAVLGGVLGSRAAQNKDAPSTATSASAAPETTTSSRSRVKSTTGTWNGTGLSSCPGPPKSAGFLTFQDFTGTVNAVTYSWDNKTSKLTVLNSTPLNGIKASPGTGLYCVDFNNDTAVDALQLIYVNTDGHLADAFQHTPYTGDWDDGNLGKSQVSAPTDLRNGLLYMVDSYDGPQLGSTGSKLYAGVSDGHSHGYSIEYLDQVWDTANAQLSNFTEASAYSGIDSFDLHPNNNYSINAYNRTLFTTDDSGTILGYLQENGITDNSTHYPVGNPFGLVNTSTQKAAPYSGIAVVQPNIDWGKLWLLFPTIQGAIGVLPARGNGTASVQFGTYSSVLESFKIMPGSDMHLTYPDYETATIFYQDEATSIAWLAVNVDNLSPKGNGRIISQNGKWASTS